MIPVVLSISIEDVYGGEGLLVDIKTAQALQVYGAGLSQGMVTQKNQRKKEISWNQKEMICSRLEALDKSITPTVIKLTLLEEMPHLEIIYQWIQTHWDIPIILEAGHANLEGGIDEKTYQVIGEILQKSDSLLILDQLQIEKIKDKTYQFERELIDDIRAYLTGNILIRNAKIQDKEGHLLLQKTGIYLWVEREKPYPDLLGVGDTLSAGIAAFMARGHSLKRSIVCSDQFLQSVEENKLYLGKDLPVVVPSKLKIIERICDMKKLLFIINPTSGKGLIYDEILDIIDIFTKAGYITTTYPTQQPQDARRCVKDIGSQFDRIVCSGGDGTLDEVVTGIMESELNHIPVGYLPSGSTNDFARTLHLPTDLILAANTVVKGESFKCDIGEFMDTYFVYVAAFGIFSDVSYKTDQGMKNILGHTAYILEGIKSLGNIQSYHLRVRANGQVYEDTFIYGMVSNSISIGGFEGITGNDIELSDGLFEVTLVKYPSNILDVNEIITSLNDADATSDMVISFKASEITIESIDQTEIPWSLDGEYGGSYRNIHIENHQEAVSFLTSQEDSIQEDLE